MNCQKLSVNCIHLPSNSSLRIAKVLRAHIATKSVRATENGCINFDESFRRSRFVMAKGTAPGG